MQLVQHRTVHHACTLTGLNVMGKDDNCALSMKVVDVP